MSLADPDSMGLSVHLVSLVHLVLLDRSVSLVHLVSLDYSVYPVS